MSVKEQVLKILENNRGSTFSGEALANEMNVSRAAVHKAVKALREEGFCIEASSNKGYFLSADSDVLSIPGIAANLAPGLSDIPIYLYSSLDSTNKTAKELALNEHPDIAVIIANEQSEGRGRLGRSFYSPADTGIYMSILFRPAFDMSKAGLLTTAAASAVSRAIETLTDLEAKIKWVNDVYVSDKKVCGILTEALSDFESGNIDSIILGIGINCSTVSFPEDIKDIAGSLESANSETTKTTDSLDLKKSAGHLGNANSLKQKTRALFRNVLTAEVLNNTISLLQKLDPTDFMEHYKEHSLVLGQEINVYKTGYSAEKTGITATATDIDLSGGLLVTYPSGKQEVLNTGEVSVRTMKGEID